ncbi:hypothetical protein [Bacillus sp. 2205SS5-2]|uniref:hypothetical protein n=1 Tax=Bacillus sp. 2205SS5-2 TaxID=3109031 RepID=UPI003007AC57
MTINFPISNKERNFSIFIYETLFSFVAIFFLSFSVVLSMLLIHQFTYVNILIVNLLYVSSFTYLALQVISKLTSFICYFFRISKMFHVINISILVLIFAMFFSQAQELVKKLANDFLLGTNEAKSFLLLFQNVHQEFGFLLTTLIYVALCLIFIGVIIIIPDQSYMSKSRNILITGTKSMRLMKAYVLSSLRNMNTINTVALVYLAAFILMIFQLSDFILYTTIILAINGIYSFIYSQNLRQLMYKFNYVPWKDYLYLVTSQIIMVYLISIPIFLSGIFIVDSVVHLFLPYLVVTLGVLIFVLAGILFPPYNDNPFSVLTSITIVTIPVLVIGISLTFLNLGNLLNSLFFFLFYVVIILFSIQGLINLKRSFRSEKNDYSH